jgi:Xaa-Pro aminopeptidase
VNARIDRLRASLEEPLLVTAGFNVLYLTGFQSTNAAVLVEPDRVRLFSDFRYAEAARAVEGVEFTETRRNIFASLPELLSGRIGFEADALTYAAYQALAAGDLEVVPRRGLVEALRAVKEDEELDAIRGAAAITDQAYERLAEERFVGRTEEELAWRMFELFRETGGDWIAFPTIVATGPNGALPHAKSGDRRIEPGHSVVVDAGCRLGWYCSDCTRTFAAGELPAELKSAYDVCREAQEAGLAAVRAGVPGRDADAAARRVIEDAGHGDAFGHGLGHGLGLEVHEAPGLRPESDDVLAAANVVTVEPGIYLSGLGGIRIEDLVIVTDDGAEVLSTFPKDLVIVD